MINSQNNIMHSAVYFMNSNEFIVEHQNLDYFIKLQGTEAFVHYREI